MKKLYLLLLSVYLLFCLDSCRQSDEFELKGELEGITSDMILVVFDDPDSKLDTIYPRGGKFTYAFSPDTLNTFRLVNDSGEVFPIFADKGWKVSVKGSFAHPEIKGDGPNNEYQEFLQSIHALKDSAQICQQAENFIKSHPSSPASAYILYWYFSQSANPNLSLIARLTEPLTGKVKDCRVLNEVLQKLPEKEKSTSTYLNYLSVKKRNGEYLSWSSSGTQKQYSLINFWASWDKESIAIKDSLYALCEKFSKNNFRVVNFSLDYNKEEWGKNTQKDTEQWIEVCDYKGWNNQILKQQNIQRLPYNILIDRNRKILGSNLYGNALQTKMKALIAEDKQQK
ncbi:thioredoxin-like domain-containing protein [Phocaeicola plebeius]|uniref:thioredoxin-like domain-containing protein n=2 Tax=Phocaeicola plebeius TaxID=310297 RepID=UPI00241E7BFF|nr:thioredoxin-like domain-containing protein [Phocaeicola plebeius]